MENLLKTLKHQILQERIPLLRGVRGVFFTRSPKSSLMRCCAIPKDSKPDFVPVTICGSFFLTLNTNKQLMYFACSTVRTIGADAKSGDFADLALFYF
jgi:hypothetical protein